MPIDKLTICDWGGRSYHQRVISDPVWDQIEAAIRALNNENLNDIYLAPDDTDPETYLCVGGGAGRYLCSGSIRNELFPTRVDAHRPSVPQEQLVIGGQSGDYPGNWILNLASALNAAKSFFESGGFSEGGWTNV